MVALLTEEMYQNLIVYNDNYDEIKPGFEK